MRRAAPVAVALAVLGVVACFPQGDCETAWFDYCNDGDPNCQGRITHGTHGVYWESGPIDGKWITFGPEVRITMHMRDAVTGEVLSGKIVNLFGLVGANQTQDPNGILPASCGGQLCEMLPNLDDPTSSSFKIENDTCSSEFFYAIATVEPTTTDAGADASTDGATE